MPGSRVAVGLLDRVNARAEKRSSIDTWISEYLLPAQFGYGGNQYSVPQLNQTYSQGKLQEISRTLPGYMAAARNCPPVFGAQLVRSLVLSQARFTFRNPPWHAKTPRRVFGSSALGPLERPWKNATTGELLSRMEWHAGLAGNAYVVKQPTRLRVLRPDWVAILYGSDLEPDDPMHAVDGELLGYVYCNGGIGNGTARTLLPDEVAHWSPIPDPESAGIGMSWITPAIRDIQGDIAATDHKLQFFKNGATPNLVVKGLPNTSPKAYWDVVDQLEQTHTGVKNAYKTLYLTAGADATVVGSDMKQIDFKATQGSGETRISLLSRVPATILGISEGLAGSSLNAGNFGMSRRIFADSWVYPMLQDLSASLASLIRVPNDAEMWFDTTDIPLLREDAKDAADIASVKATAIRQLTDGGFDPVATVATVAPEWTTTLQHTGKLSVQLQEPGAEPPSESPPKQEATPPATRRRGVRRFSPNQKRDPNGKWGDGVPGPQGPGLDDIDDIDEVVELEDDEAGEFDDASLPPAYREQYGKVLAEYGIGAEDQWTVTVTEKRGFHVTDDTGGRGNRTVIQELKPRTAQNLSDAVFDVHEGGDPVKVRGLGAQVTGDGSGGLTVTWKSGARTVMNSDEAFDFQEALTNMADSYESIF